MKTIKAGNAFALSIEGLRGACAFCQAEVELDANDTPAKGRVLLEPEGDVAVYTVRCLCGKVLHIRANPVPDENPLAFAARSDTARRDGRFWAIGTEEFIEVEPLAGEPLIPSAAPKKSKKE
jgi:hypothetical protein